MSKWKDTSVKIVNTNTVSRNSSWIDIFGLGSDGKMYTWDKLNGAWLKYWDEEDVPNE